VRLGPNRCAHEPVCRLRKITAYRLLVAWSNGRNRRFYNPGNVSELTVNSSWFFALDSDQSRNDRRILVMGKIVIMRSSRGARFRSPRCPRNFNKAEALRGPHLDLLLAKRTRAAKQSPDRIGARYVPPRASSADRSVGRFW
jgi:hypothetical protein